MPVPTPPSPPADGGDPRQFARRATLTYGDWGRFKRLYKETEAHALTRPQADASLFGLLTARVDAAPLSSTAAPLSVNLGDNSRGIADVAVAGETLCCLFQNWGRPTEVAVCRVQPDAPLTPLAQGRFSVAETYALAACGPVVAVLRGTQRAVSVGLLDVRDPAAPRWGGQVDVGGRCAAAGAYPYLHAVVSGAGDGFAGLRVVDVSDPDSPRIVGEAAIPGATDIAVSEDGRRAVVVSGGQGFRWNAPPQRAGLTTVDLSDPRAPRVAGALPLENAQGVAVAGTRAFVGGTGRTDQRQVGLCVFDIADLARPRQIGFVGTNALKVIAPHGGYAILMSSYGGIQIADVRDPAKPVIAARLSSSLASSLAVSGDTLYVGQNYAGLEMYSLLNPAKPARIGSPPSSGTVGYMKRRARRVLRTLAKQDADAYVRLASETLAAAKSGEPMDPARQWVTADVLYGGSDRYTQPRHGRGPLTPGPARFRLKAREERAPEAWDRHPELASALLTNPGLPWQTHEAAYKMLAATGGLPADVPDALLAAFVSGDAPLLIRFAARRIAARPALSGVDPNVAAQAYFKSGRAVRRTMGPGLTARAGDEAWGRAFLAQMFNCAAGSLTGGLLSRRAATALDAAARDFAARADRKDVEKLLAPLLSADRPALLGLVLDFARRVKAGEVGDLLAALDGVDAARRDPVVDALVQGMAGRTFDIGVAQRLVLSPGSEFVRASGWRLLEASATVPGVLETLWTILLDTAYETPALRTAMASPSALALLDRSGLSADDIVQKMRDRPFLVALLAPETFAAITQRVPAPVTLALVGAAADAQWPGLRGAWLRGLREGVGLTDLWLAAPAALESAADDRLERRLLGDAEVADTFLGVDDPALLDIRDPAFGPLLGRWVRRRENLFAANSALLLQAATHVLPDVRDWALGRVRALGMDLPFALRLLEAALPASAEAGTEFFFGLPSGDGRELGHVLALCDSPFAPVRALGFGFVRDRWETLPHDALLSALFETSHADAQAFVAALLADTDQPQETPRFDREVLRTRHAARRAKEAVKARQSAAPTLDAATLLSLARGKTARDSEWALAQLARLAAGGQAIEGVSVDGVAGG